MQFMLYINHHKCYRLGKKSPEVDVFDLDLIKEELEEEPTLGTEGLEENDLIL